MVLRYVNVEEDKVIIIVLIEVLFEAAEPSFQQMCALEVGIFVRLICMNNRQNIELDKLYPQINEVMTYFGFIRQENLENPSCAYYSMCLPNWGSYDASVSTTDGGYLFSSDYESHPHMNISTIDYRAIVIDDEKQLKFLLDRSVILTKMKLT